VGSATPVKVTFEGDEIPNTDLLAFTVEREIGHPDRAGNVPKDPEAKASLRTAFDSARLQAEVEVYPAAHGWCPSDSRVYDPAQSDRAWARLLATFGHTLA